jgi:hypothetical protein
VLEVAADKARQLFRSGFRLPETDTEALYSEDEDSIDSDLENVSNAAAAESESEEDAERYGQH